MGHASIILIAFVSFALFACKKKSEPIPAAVRPTSAAPVVSNEEATHARPGVQPGSHDDWCGEHQVPESLCTRCNPSLIVAFKATGDWCEEHRLPESQCLICNPDLKIERPPRTSEASP